MKNIVWRVGDGILALSKVFSYVHIIFGVKRDRWMVEFNEAPELEKNLIFVPLLLYSQKSSRKNMVISYRHKTGK